MPLWNDISRRLSEVLVPFGSPIGITFSPVPTGVPRLKDAISEPTPSGRTGQVPAGCVFWMRGTGSRFTTTQQDHANCSVGSFTHGFIPLSEAAAQDDVSELLTAQWVRVEDFASIEHVRSAPSEIVHGPLADFGSTPDVILMRINAKSLMICHDAWPGLRIEGKPQCHIVAIAKESNVIAASVGCMLSRTRTGMGANELTLALPGAKAAEFVDAIEATVETDALVAEYAAIDSERFT